MQKIAIVDDEVNILQVLDSFLSRKYEVETFNHPINALQKILHGNYDLVLLDIMMPDMTGIELLKKLRENNNQVKVIMMTAYDSIDKALEVHTFGAKNYLKKPFKDLKEIQDIIAEELN